MMGSSSETMPARARRKSMLVSTLSRRGSQAELLIVQQDTGGGTMQTGALLADLMDKAGGGWYQVLVLPCLLGVQMVEFGKVQVISTLAKRLQLDWDLTDTEKAMLPTLCFFGLAVGTIGSGIFSDVLGRRRAIITSYIAVALVTVPFALSQSFLQMAVMIFLNGAACGLGVAAVLVMITELCPRSIRAVGFVLPGLAASLGEVYALTVVDILMPDLQHGNWHWVIMLAAAPAYVFLGLSLALLRESPYWLVSQGRISEARAEILEIARVNGTSENVEVLAQTLDSDIVAETESLAKQSSEDTLATLRKALSQGRFLLMAVAFGFLAVTGQLLTFGMSYLWPQLLQSESFEGSNLNPATALGLIRACGVPSALLMLPIMWSSIGNRWVIGTASVLDALVLQGCLLTIVYHWPNAIVPLAGLSIACANLFYTTITLFMTESYPTKVRAIMTAFNITFGRIGAFAGPELIEWLQFQGFLCLAAGLACCAVPTLMLLKETKGQQLEDFLDDEPDAYGPFGERTPLLAQTLARVQAQARNQPPSQCSEVSSESDGDRSHASRV